jgi:WD40 repeat protein
MLSRFHIGKRTVMSAAAAVVAALLLSCADDARYMFVPEAGADGRVRIFDFRSWFDLSPTGKELAYVDEKSGTDLNLVVFNFETGRERVLTTMAGIPIWSPDGEWITYAKQNNGGVWVVRRDGSGDRCLYWDPYGCGPADWSPDGTKILFGVFRAQPGVFDIYYYDLVTDEPFYVMKNEYYKFSPFARWLPDGERVIINRAVGGDEVISIADLNGSLVCDVWRFDPSVFPGFLQAISRTGDRLIFSVTGETPGGRPRIWGNWIFDFKTRRWEQALFNPDPAAIRDHVVRWLPDGRVIFSSFLASEGTPLAIYSVYIP